MGFWICAVALLNDGTCPLYFSFLPKQAEQKKTLAIEVDGLAWFIILPLAPLPKARVCGLLEVPRWFANGWWAPQIQFGPCKSKDGLTRSMVCFASSHRECLPKKARAQNSQWCVPPEFMSQLALCVVNGAWIALLGGATST